MKTEPIKLTFKSGSLWHEDYQVINPEVIPGVVRGGVNQRLLRWDSKYEASEDFVDGDQITLPDGYWIKTVLACQHESCPVDGSCDNCADQKRIATITPQSRQGTAAHGFCVTPGSTCNMNYCDENGCQDRKRELVEPSESQEEMWKEVVDKISKTVESYVNEFIDSSSEQMRDDLRTDLEELKQKFTITRK